MRSIVERRRTAVRFTALFSAVIVIVSSRALATEDVTSAPCTSPAYRQFDFWIGDWEVFDVASRTKVAHARIEAILDGCVLREDYQGRDGHQGQSFTIYDSSRNVWHQTWVTNRDERLEIEGKFENGEMVLSGKNRHGSMVRGTWRPLKREVRETALTSSDGERNWNPWFDLIFRRADDSASKTAAATDAETDEKQTVAELDTEYQEAVKRNDTATMDRILSDDFILVTGSGNVYTKRQLLDEARSGRFTYEHQEDTERTVRVWGDTAIVTAQLWEKGLENSKPFEHKLWFSDVYRRTPFGWRYVFAQSAYRPCQSIP